MPRTPSWSIWLLVVLQLLLFSLLLSPAAAATDNQCSSNNGRLPVCGNYTCPFGACTNCYEINGYASATCSNSAASAGAALAGGIVAVIVILPLLAFCVAVSVAVCCCRGLCCFAGSAVTQRWQQRGVVYSSAASVAVYGQSGPTVVYQPAVSTMQLAAVSVQPQPMYAQPVNAYQAQPAVYAGQSQPQPMAPQYAQQRWPQQYPPHPQYAPQQQYSPQPQPVFYPLQQQQQWQ